MSELELLNRRLDRERRARKEAERLLEEKSLELFRLNEDLRRSLQRSAEGEARVRTIMDNVPNGVFTTTVSGRIETFNKAAERMSGYAADEVIGRQASSLVPSPDHDDFDSALGRFFDSGDLSAFQHGPRESMGRRKDGSHFPVDLIIVGFQLGDEPMYITAFRDISERKAREAEKAALEGQLRQSQKLESMGTLAGGIAHEFNNMLVPMIGLTKMVIDDLPDESEAREDLSMVLDTGYKARELVAKILAFARNEQSERGPVSLQSVIDDVRPLLRTTLPATIEIREALERDDLIVEADATELQQVFLSLASNAADAMAGGTGEFTIELSATVVGEREAACHPELSPGDHARLRIRDTGAGMDGETRARLFEPFFTTKEVGQGTGMGMAVVHSIITGVGGAITVTGTLGEGTCFEILLPICQPAAMSDVAA